MTACDPASQNGSTLTNPGSGITSTSYTINGKDVSFTISDIDQRTGGKRSSRYIEEVTVTYNTGSGADQTYGVFSGSGTVSVSLGADLFVASVTVLLADGYDGNSSTSLSVDIGTVSYCVEGGASAAEAVAIGAADGDSGLSEVKVYPNPASSVLNISLPGQDMLNARLTLYNYNGQLLRNEVVNRSSYQLRVGDLSDGLYLLIVNDQYGNTVINKRIVVKK